MAGYVNQSPVKKVWIPLNYDFIQSLQNETWDNGCKKFKEKYGIDLNEIIFLDSGAIVAKGDIGVYVEDGGTTHKFLNGCVDNSPFNIIISRGSGTGISMSELSITCVNNDNQRHIILGIGFGILADKPFVKESINFILRAQ